MKIEHLKKVLRALTRRVGGLIGRESIEGRSKRDARRAGEASGEVLNWLAYREPTMETAAVMTKVLFKRSEQWYDSRWDAAVNNEGTNSDPIVEVLHFDNGSDLLCAAPRGEMIDLQRTYRRGGARQLGETADNKWMMSIVGTSEGLTQLDCAQADVTLAIREQTPPRRAAPGTQRAPEEVECERDAFSDLVRRTCGPTWRR